MLVLKYGVGYVLLGPQELGSPRNANKTYWDKHGTVVYTNGEYTVYKT
jgi:hypothetical protein